MKIYKNLGSHVSLTSSDIIKQYADAFQFCLSDPKLFISDFSMLNKEALKWRTKFPDKTLVCHGPYNSNILCSGRYFHDSFSCLTQSIKACEKNKIKYFVIHPGVLGYLDKKSEKYSIKYAKNFIEKFFLVFKKANILLENMSSLKSLKLEALYAIVKDYDNMGICLDTNHAFGRGESMKTVEKFLAKAKTKVIHLNAVPRDLEYGSGEDRHSKLSISQSKGIASETLKSWVFKYPNKIKIMEQFPTFAVKSFRFISK